MPETNGLKQKYDDARRERKALETEIAALDGKLKQAVTSADAAGMLNLKARKAELPRLFIQNSAAERKASEAYFKVEHEAAFAKLRQAEDEQTALELAIEEMKIEQARVMHELTSKLYPAKARVNQARLAVQDWGAWGLKNARGYEGSLAQLADLQV